MMRLISLVATVAALLASIACGGGEDGMAGSPDATSREAPTTSTSAAATEPAFDPQDALLTIDDFPSGWAQLPEDDEEGPRACRVDTVSAAPRSARVEFAAGGTAPLLSLAVGAYPAGGAREPVAEGIARLRACTSYEADGETVEVLPVSFPQMGDESYATLIRTDRISGIVILTRVGDGVAGIVYADTFSVDAGEAERYGRAAVARLREAQPRRG